MERPFLFLGAISAFIAVAVGAFGAHSLKTKLTPEMLAIFEVGVRYQMYHAFGMMVIAFATAHWPDGNFSWSGWLFAIGTILFSGSLYAYALTGIKTLGAITPFGGLCFLAGWAYLAWKTVV